MRRENSSRRSRIRGRVASAGRATVVAAPVRAELNTSDERAVTVISAASATSPRTSDRFVAVPRFTMTSRRSPASKPSSVTVTVYRPPTLRPGIVKRPSAREATP